MEKEFYKYLTPGDNDKDWGIFLNVAGYAEIKPQDTYPSKGHPNGYDFTWQNGRILNEFQLNYITDGHGIMETKTATYKITPGTIITIAPNVWHRYRPDPKTGWKEHYIGFKGKFAKRLIKENYSIYANKPVLYVGFKDKILEPFNKIIDEVKEEKVGYQQVCAGLLMCMIGNILSVIRNKEFAGKLIEKKILTARLYIRDNIYEDIDMNALACELNLSYSYFRTLFKKFTGISPAQYHLLLRLQKSRELLVSSDKSIKEIAYELNFQSIYYFSQIFKDKMGMCPSKIRM